MEASDVRYVISEGRPVMPQDSSAPEEEARQGCKIEGSKQSNNVVLFINSDREAIWAVEQRPFHNSTGCCELIVFSDLLCNDLQSILLWGVALVIVQCVASATFCAETQATLTAHIVTTVVAVVSAAVCAITTLDAAHIVFCIAWCATILHFGAHCEKGNENWEPM